MTRIVVLGDIHDHQERLGETLELVSDSAADLVVLTGDLGQDPPWSAEARRSEREAHDRSVKEVVDCVLRTLAAPVVFVPGNHDLPDPATDVAGTNADRRTVELAGLSIAGLGGAGPARFGFPYEWDEEEAETGLRGLGADRAIDLLLCHAPPAGCRLDLTVHRQHVGSRAVAEAIERLRPRLFVCGHIHEAWGVEALFAVPCLNAGSLGEPYGQRIAWRIDWNGGPERIASVQLENGRKVGRLHDLRS